jgi:hypothetical protein
MKYTCCSRFMNGMWNRVTKGSRRTESPCTNWWRLRHPCMWGCQVRWTSNLTHHCSSRGVWALDCTLDCRYDYLAKFIHLLSNLSGHLDHPRFGDMRLLKDLLQHIVAHILHSCVDRPSICAICAIYVHLITIWAVQENPLSAWAKETLILATYVYITLFPGSV